jgi:hypothetical protein
MNPPNAEELLTARIQGIGEGGKRFFLKIRSAGREVRQERYYP